MSSINYCESCGVTDQVNYTTPPELNLRLCGRENCMYGELRAKNPKLLEKADIIYKKNFDSYKDAVKFWSNFNKKPFCDYCGQTNSKKYLHVFSDRMICTKDNVEFTQLLREKGFEKAIDAFPKRYVLNDKVIVQLSSLQPKSNSNQINGTEQLDGYPKATNRYSNETLTSQDLSSTRMMCDEPIDSKNSEDTIPPFDFMQQMNSISVGTGERFECLDMAVECESVHLQEALNADYRGTRDDYNYIFK